MKNDNGYISRAEMLLIGAKKKPILRYVPKRQGKKRGGKAKRRKFSSCNRL